MKKFSALVAPALLTSFAAMAGTPTTAVEITYPQSRNEARVVLKATQICGAYSAFSQSYRAEGNNLIATFTVIGQKCGLGDIPKNKTFEFNVNVASEAVAAGIQTLNPTLKSDPVILKLK